MSLAFTRSAYDGGNGHEQIVDQTQGRGQQDALAEILGVEIAHGQGVEGNADDEKETVPPLDKNLAQDTQSGGTRW